MKNKLLFVLALWLALATPVWAQTSNTTLTINCTSGGLNVAIPDADKQVISMLILTGTMDARDFKTMRDLMPALKEIDLSGVKIEAYTGTEGPYDFNGNYNEYKANSIPACAFFSFSKKMSKRITSFSFPKDVTEIGDYAFRWCDNLKGKINLPQDLTTIGKEAFNGCRGLTGNLTLPKTITSIGSHAFVGCTGFTGTLELPASIKAIGMYTFAGCQGLTGTVNIPNSVTSIGAFAFNNCTGITEFIIPESVKTIGERAFLMCNKVKSITINNGTPINLSSSPSVFWGINKKDCTLNVPYGTTDLYKAADQWKDFNKIVTDLNGFTLNTNTASLTSAAGSSTSVGLTANVSWTASSDQPWLKVTPAAGTGNSELKLTAETETSSVRTATVTVSADNFPPKTIQVKQTGVTAIAINCTAGGLSTAIPDAEKKEIIKLTITGTIDARDFKTMRDEMPALKEIDLSQASVAAYKGTKGTESRSSNYAENAIPQYAFFNSYDWISSSISSFVFPTSITTIGKSAFYECASLASTLTIPNGVTTIDTCAFQGCKSLTGSLTIPRSVTAIRSAAFEECRGLNGQLTIPNSVVSIGAYAFSDCNGLTGNLAIPQTVTSIDDGAFYKCSGFTGNLTIPSSIKEINKNTFEGCSGFTGNLTIPESVKVIREGAFYGCRGLTGSLILPGTITSIEKEAFCNCSGFTGNLTIPSSITKISTRTFCGCSGFNGSLTMPESVKVIGESAFYDCKGLTGNLTIPKSATTIGKFAFTGCNGFNGNLTIHESVSFIGECAFNGCSGIKHIYANNSVPIDLSASPNVFIDIDKSTCKLNVPYGSKEAYRNADQWKDFLSNIVESDQGFRVASAVVNIGAAAQSSASVDVKANVAWSVSCDQSWLKVSPSTSTATDGTIKVIATTENTWKPRTAAVTVSSPNMDSKTIVVTQTATLYQEEPTVPLSENMDATAPVVDRPSTSLELEKGKLRYLRFKPTVSGTYNIVSQSEHANPAATLYDNNGAFLYTSDDEYEYEGNSYNFLLSYKLKAGQVYYIQIHSKSNGSNPIPINITGGDLECFTWEDKDKTGSWNTPTNWNWEALPKPNNSIIVNGTIALDQDVTANRFTVLSSSNVSNAPSRMLYANDIITNKGTITNNGTIFTGNKLMNYGVINNNGKIVGPAFAPIVFEENGGAELEDLMPQYGSKITLPEPIKPGSTFIGWYIDKDLKSKFEATTMPLNGITLYARWIAVPTVKTYGTKDTGTTTATINSTIVDFGAPTPSQYGIVWSTSANPTVALSTRTEHGVPASKGDFTDNITGLLPNTTYYVKAYATNTTGIAYSEEVSFTTKSIPVITWNTPTSIAYGKPLGEVLPKATANTPGNFTYYPSLESVLNAGDGQTIKVDFSPADASYISVSKTIKINVDKAKLTISKPTVVTAKLYDGNTSANITSIGLLSGVIPADQAGVSVTASANYNDAAAGSNKTIKVAYTLTGNAIGNYIVPDDYIINGASISEPITIIPLEAAQAGCEGEKSNLSYTVLSGKPVEYQIIFDDKAVNAGFKNAGYTTLLSTYTSNTVQISVPSKIADGTYNASLQLRDEHGIASKPFPFQLTVNVSADAIVTKFGSIVLIDNHDNRFKGYQWYKNGSAISGATSQFYKDPNGLSGTYHAQLKTATGQTLNTCSKAINIKKSAQASVSIYPNPARSGQEFSVRLSGFANEELQGAVLSVYSTQGVPVLTSRKVEQENRLTLSGTDGVYMGRITTADGQVLTFKVVLAN